MGRIVPCGQSGRGTDGLTDWHDEAK